MNKIQQTNLSNKDNQFCNSVISQFKPSWSLEEKKKLSELFELYSGNWKTISQHLNGQSPYECMIQWQSTHPNKIVQRQTWSKEEDDQLKELVQKYGKKWSKICTIMNWRTGKQVRERYLNQLQGTIKQDKWTDEEDKIILKLYKKFGSKWSYISSFLQGRPENMVKNRFYANLKRRFLQNSDNSSFDESQYSDSDKQSYSLSYKQYKKNRMKETKRKHNNNNNKLQHKIKMQEIKQEIDSQSQNSQQILNLKIEQMSHQNDVSIKNITDNKNITLNQFEQYQQQQNQVNYIMPIILNNAAQTDLYSQLRNQNLLQQQYGLIYPYQLPTQQVFIPKLYYKNIPNYCQNLEQLNIEQSQFNYNNKIIMQSDYCNNNVNKMK